MQIFLVLIIALATLSYPEVSTAPSGSTIIGSKEPGTIIQGPKSKATVRGANGKVILGGGDTGVIHAKGRDGGVVGASGTSPGVIAASAPSPAFTILVADLSDETNIVDPGIGLVGAQSYAEAENYAVFPNVADETRYVINNGYKGYIPQQSRYENVGYY